MNEEIKQIVDNVDNVDNVDKKNKIEVVVVKKKKKRGRKPKPKPLNSIPKVPKKRGRKPKVINLGEEKKKKKKRGRKPKNKYGFVPKKNIEPMDVENDNIILHIPITAYEIDNCTKNKNKNDEPQGYNNNNEFFVLEESNIVNKNVVKKNIDDIISERNDELGTYKVDNQVHYTLLPFYEANKNTKWLNSTNICCFWCTESFDNVPIGLPIKVENNIFYVDGCFCSLECAAAYNFNETESSIMWERHSLLNLLYTKIFNDSKIGIKAAPPRRALKKFGGILTIKQFRKFNNNYYKQYKLVIPPMISSLPSLEKIDLSNDVKRKYNYIPIDNERIKNLNNNLVLKRDKPINNYKNTLENCMNLKYV